MIDSTLLYVALAITIAAVAILAKVLYSIRPQKKAAYDQELDDMIHGYEFQLPKEAQDYELIKNDPSMDRKKVAAALFKRAIAIIPIARRTQSDAMGMGRLRRNDVLRDDAFSSYDKAKELLEEELGAIQEEANEIRGDNWGETILREAAQFYDRMMHQKEQAEQKKAQAALAERKKKEEAEAAARAKAKEEQQREKAYAELMKEAEKEGKKTK